MKSIFITLLIAIISGIIIGFSSCSDDDCQVDGENCSVSYREANNIDYDCCSRLTCSDRNGYLVCN